MTLRKRFRSYTLVAVLVALGCTAPANAALRAPSLDAPGNEAAVEGSPVFTWNAVNGSDHYEFRLSADSQFGSVLSAIDTRSTAATLTGTLTDGTYYWRVRAISPAKRAGKWSSVRTLKKKWTTQAELLSPTTDFGAVWPTAPLVFEWAAVPHATSYALTVATDASMAQPVLGGADKPQTTQGTVLAFPGTLAAGTYYWQVTPIDADGHKGTPSAIGRFSWGWPSTLSLTVEDLNPAREVFDPLLRWSEAPGAAKYEVEVNTSEVFAPGSIVDTETVYGASVSPTKQLPNNTYYWRVRAIDPDGRAGAYYTGSFEKKFDAVAPDPSVSGFTLNEGQTALTSLPTTVTDAILTWNPVPGASQYEVEVAPRGTPMATQPNDLCQWNVKPNGFGSELGAYTFLPYIDIAVLNGGPDPGGKGNSTRQDHVMFDGQGYCARVRAIDSAGHLSDWTYLGGFNDVQTAFTYANPASVVGPADCTALPAATLSTPSDGASLTRTPKFHWNTVGGARTYYFILARDQSLTNVVDVALTDRTYYVPRKSYTDENTGYYWTVWPSRTTNGACPTPVYSTRRFDKITPPPVLEAPDAASSITGQPVFRWDASEAAASYRIQVARDSEYKEVVDDVTTASTVYAPSGTYPVDTQLYWRVRAKDGNGVEPGWSDTRTFRRTLPTPVIDASNPTTGGTIPVLSWQPVSGAISYGFHVDKVDGSTQDFTVTTPKFTPTEFYGNGIWKWKVRANFPGSNGAVSGPFTAPKDFVRRLLPPAGLRAAKTPRRIVYTWNPDPAAKNYRIEVATDDSFSSTVSSLTTPNTAFAPSLEGAYVDGGKLYWRVASVDSGGNVGAFARGDLRLPARLILTADQTLLPRGQRTKVKVTVTTPRGTKMRGVRVKFSGAGTKGSKKTGKKGTVVLTIRPHRKGKIKLTATRKGYTTGTLEIQSL